MNMRETHIVGTGTVERLVAPGPTLARVGMFMAGLSVTEPATGADRFRFVRLNADYPQLMACYQGAGRVQLGGRWVTCGPGSAYVTPAGTTHAYHAMPARGWRVAWVLYRPGRACPISTGEPQLVRLDPRPLRDAIGGLVRETIGRAAPAALAAWAGLVQLYANRALHESGAGDTLWPVWTAVAGDLARRWTLDELARLAAVSPEHLRRLCHRQLGRTPMQQVARLRMDRAATMLAGGPQKVDAIAAAVGYGDRFAFAHAFRRHFGQPPGAYRQG